MSASQRLKGAEGEREACRLLSEEFGLPVARKLGQARDSGEDIELGPFTIEVKRRKRIGMAYDWIAQVSAAGDRPVVMCREDGGEWLVIVPFAEWARLARGEL